MATSLNIPANDNIKTWPQLMLQVGSKDVWLVHQGAANRYGCYNVDNGYVVNRGEITDLRPLPKGTTLTFTNE